MDRPDGWVYVVAMNQLRDRWRRSDRHHLVQAKGSEDAADNTGGIATRLSVRQLIATLPPRQRQAIVLRYLADLQVGDVAEAMGCALGTAKATIHQALQNLRVELDDTEEDDDAHG
jgi:RNA polymerase sigma factor (sigma-70 family)